MDQNIETQNQKSEIHNRKYKAIVIGVSAGGLKAVKTILPHLPSDFEYPVIVVMHRQADSDDYVERHLDNECDIHVKQADEKEDIKNGVVFFAPPNYHLLVEEDNTFSLTVEGVVNYSRPSIDVLFESAAYVYGQGLIGIVLTGANSDGSQGLKIIKESGGLTIVQEPGTAEFDDMPRAAITAVGPDYVLPLEEIGHFIRKLVNEDLKLET